MATAQRAMSSVERAIAQQKARDVRSAERYVTKTLGKRQAKKFNRSMKAAASAAKVGTK